MARVLTKKQKGFVKDYLETGNGTLAVKRNYDVKDDKVAGVMASENLGKPRVREYLESKADRAAEIVMELAETSEVDSVRLGASKDILDRAGYKPVDKQVSIKLGAKDFDVFDEKIRAHTTSFEEELKKELGYAQKTEESG